MKFKNSYKFISINTNYWRPGINPLKTIIDNLDNKLYDEDIIIFSEKALSIALGRIIDEKNIKPSLLAKFLARVWMRIVWGYFLSIVCFLKKKNILRLRNYPIEYGAYHKQVALSYVGFLESLRHFSEGGIDASNLPYTYVSLPLRNPDKLTNKIKEEIFKKTGKNIGVIIIDGDSTFNFKNFYFSPRKTIIKNKTSIKILK
ncbi:MAG: coenzyme F420-0:L-glutamate ligase [Nitrososphaerota archaeon]